MLFLVELLTHCCSFKPLGYYIWVEISYVNIHSFIHSLVRSFVHVFTHAAPFIVSCCSAILHSCSFSSYRPFDSVHASYQLRMKWFYIFLFVFLNDPNWHSSCPVMCCTFKQKHFFRLTIVLPNDYTIWIYSSKQEIWMKKFTRPNKGVQLFLTLDGLAWRQKTLDIKSLQLQCVKGFGKFIGFSYMLNMQF